MAENLDRAGGARIERLNPNIGAEVVGVDLSEPLSDADFKIVHRALVEHEVIVFRNQDITVDQQISFAERFGELSIHPFSPNMETKPAVIVLDNHEKNPPRLTDVWHSDETFRECPPMGTMLRSRIVPRIGGDTLFASMTCAYEGLSDRIKTLIDGLEAVHDFKPFRTLFSNAPEDRAKLRTLEDKYPNPTHPVVRVHPVTGRRIINVNPQFTTRIVGMSEREGDAILKLLYAQANVPDYQYRNRWEENMIVFWDNRSTQHYAVHDYYPQRRKMERVTIVGDKPFGVGNEGAVEAVVKRQGKAFRQEGLEAVSADVPKRQFERT
jgi:taurine dioxygenase